MEPQTAAPDTVFFDGDCGFCHRAVSFIVRRDRHARFRFAPRGGRLFNRTFTTQEREAFPQSMIVRTFDDRTLLKSDGTIYILHRLGSGWAILSRLLWVVPRPLRDLGYGVIARLRHRFAAKPTGACPIVPIELRARFLE